MKDSPRGVSAAFKFYDHHHDTCGAVIYKIDGPDYCDCGRDAALASYDALLAALQKAFHELNAIHARDGVPYTHNGWKASVTQEYFTSVVEECVAALKGAGVQP